MSSSCRTQCSPQTGKIIQARVIPPEIKQRIASHPCYSVSAHNRFARMHLAVAPGCNVQCNYCNRKYDCANESRPGVVSELLNPEEAVRKARHVAAAIPQLSVIGIAGPGDPLANIGRTFKTLELIRQQLPDVKLCLSTNGLGLPDVVDRLADLTVDHVTITMNTLDPYIAAEIYEWAFFGGRKYYGVEAGQLIIERQMEGLKKLQEKGVLVKVNSVLIPQRNGAHLGEVSRELNRNQVFLHNIMPLIAKPEHGTHYGLTGEPEPTAEELNAVREECGQDVAQMSHCKQCRADAIGLLGEDRSSEFSKDATPAASDLPDYFEVMHKRTRLQADLVSKGAASDDDAKLVAVASTDSQVIDEHFGHASSFAIYSVTEEGVFFINRRYLNQFCSGADECGEKEEEHNVFNLLADMDAVFCSRVGLGPWNKLEAIGVSPQVGYAWKPIEISLTDWWQEQPTVDTRAEGLSA